ncbi:unnamed protein product [Fusarium venenatum]|uniref:Uncharacterized protein n=1 Tax=Fusarium venenatum TaxID=56646 RepID=A0A2L2TRZ3_9HYPO|nr:uncharacterized protein FVRRES_00282 [Fusarium venenatum]CEI63770.1 unnamed protein product [Fusarium venenatum]
MTLTSKQAIAKFQNIKRPDKIRQEAINLCIGRECNGLAKVNGSLTKLVKPLGVLKFRDGLLNIVD